MIFRSHPRRARRALAWGAAFFAALVGATEWLLPRLDDADSVYAVRRTGMLRRLQAAGDVRGKAAPMSPDQAPGRRSTSLVTLLGSSRTLGGLRGQVLEEQLRADWRRDVCVAGFAIPGGGPVHSLVLLGRLLRDDLTPDLLLIEVLPSHLRAAELAGVFPKGSIHLSAADRDWLQQHGLAPAADPEDPAQSGGPACWRYRSAVVRRLYPRLQAGAPTWVWRADPWGSSRSPKAATSEAERRHATQRARNQYAAALKGLRLPGPGAAALRAILSECQRRGIPSALVLMPEGPEFRSWYRDKAREEVREMLGRMARECESRLIDAWEWYEEEAFADSHHLLADSARDLSARLGREVAAADQHSPTPIADRGADGALRR